MTSLLRFLELESCLYLEEEDFFEPSLLVLEMEPGSLDFEEAPR